MAKVLITGGTGEISLACVVAAIDAGHAVTVFNRGSEGENLPAGVSHVIGDVRDSSALSSLAEQRFDVVCQFIAFNEADVARDIDVFTGRCSQYIFVSTASAYQKPWPGGVITEATPLENPYLEYSRNKIAAEHCLTESGLPVTIVRPSHTYRQRLPSTCVDGLHLAWRLTQGEPVLVHDDGESLWALTHASDFSRAFVQLFGNEKALGEAVHITTEQSVSWNTIINAVADGLGVKAELVHVPTDELVSRQPAWEGPLKGDKANSVSFDNQRIRTLTNGWQPHISLEAGLTEMVPKVLMQLASYSPDPAVESLVDSIISTRP